jgi:high-affinity nickel-transport protein
MMPAWSAERILDRCEVSISTVFNRFPTGTSGDARGLQLHRRRKQEVVFQGALMVRLVKTLFADEAGDLLRKIGGLYVLLAVFNTGAWAWAFVVFHKFPWLLGTSLLAYSFGLRHAMDADHIAAIDNVTRKLMQEGKQPVTVGLMFSLGHSTIVVLASAGIAATGMTLHTWVAGLGQVGGIIGTVVSMSFLFAIAFMNMIALRSVIRAYRRLRGDKTCGDESSITLLAARGFLGHILQPLLGLITKSRHMYLLGFLFGLGFDTATEIGLLGVSAAGAAHGMSIWSILVFPVLFTAGMALIDTTDSILMCGAYGWAVIKPDRKLHYNITVTAISVVVAFLVGSVEALNLVADKLRPSGAFWAWAGGLNENLSMAGYLIIGVFMVTWLLFVAVYRKKEPDEMEVTTGPV